MAGANGIRGAAQVVTERREDLLADKRIRHLVRWARSFRRPTSEEVTNPPKLYPRDAVELLGSILVVAWKNPLMILFVGYLEPIPASVPSTVLRALNRHPRLLRAANKVLALTLRDTSTLQPGQMRKVWDTLPPDAQVDVDAVTLPNDLLWATHQRYIAEAVGVCIVACLHGEDVWGGGGGHHRANSVVVIGAFPGTWPSQCAYTMWRV